MKQLGQKSVLSLFSATTTPCRNKDVSLLEFLDKKLQNSNSCKKTMSKLSQSQETDNSELTSPSQGSAERVLDSLVSQRLLKKRKAPESSQRIRRTRNRSGSRGRLFRGIDGSQTQHVLVLGDEPAPHLRQPKAEPSRNFNFNHYADGNGFWEADMVGLDGAPPTSEWEGIGCMSMGDTLGTAL